MRFACALLLLGLSLANAGCALVEDATRNTVLAIHTPIAEHRETARNRRWAESAWENVRASAAATHSIDYADGFKEGYAEYLFRGGDGEPPLIAPLHYRKVRYQSPEGYAAIQDWFHGYRHGATIARDSGARQWITGPSALPKASPTPAEFALPARVEPDLELPMPSVMPTVPAPKPEVKPAIQAPTDASPSGGLGVPIAAPITAPTPMPTPTLRITGIHAAPVNVNANAARVRIINITNVPPED